MKKWTLGLFILGMVAFLPGINGPMFWDDDAFITDNVYVTEFNWQKIVTSPTTAGAGQINDYYRPLTSLSFAVDYWLWGE